MPENIIEYIYLGENNKECKPDKAVRVIRHEINPDTRQIVDERILIPVEG